MNAFSAFLTEPDDLKPVPLFPVEAPDGKRHLSEISRQTTFIKLMRDCAPTCVVFANANAGKRNPALAKREGIMSGVFDITVVWEGGTAWPEFKGYTAAGRAGTLSDNQIDWGNRMHRLGHSVASFFDPMAAVLWVKRVGAPVRIREGLL